MSDKYESKELEAAKKKCTPKQQKFVENIMLLNMAEGKAILGAGYDVTGSAEQITSNCGLIARANLKSKAVKGYICAIRDEMKADLENIVDEYWIIHKIKDLADTGSENIQLKATEDLAKIRGMFTEKVEVTDATKDPKDVIKKAMDRRKQRGDLKIYEEKEETS